MGLSQNTKQGVSLASRNALFYRCGATPDLLAILQVNPVLSTPIFASVRTLALLAILSNRILPSKNSETRTLLYSKALTRTFVSAIIIAAE